MLEKARPREVWRAVKDFPMYEVSNYGRVRSRWKDLQVLKPRLQDGYFRYRLFFVINGVTESKEKLAHVIVLETFKGECPAGFQSGHKNGIRTDNCITNLRWISFKQNMKERTWHSLKESRNRRKRRKIFYS